MTMEIDSLVARLERVRHKKRGAEYEVLGTGKMQTEHWIDQRWTRQSASGEPPKSSWSRVDLREVVVYRSLDDGSLWVRPREEFEDGRFERLEAAAALSRPEQVVADEMVSAAYEELRRRLTLHPSRDQVKAALEAACLTTAAPLEADASAPASPAIGVQAVTDGEEARIAEERLSSLLARIHRDGGHYEAEHGTEKAWADADAIVASMYADTTHPAHSPSALHPAPEAAPPEAAAGVEANCPDCNRHIMADPQPATGWLASCGRRLTRLDEFENPSPCRLLAEAASAGAASIETQAWECDKWPVWLHGVVDRANEAADRLDMSSEQAMAYAVLTALATPSDTAPSPKGVSDGVRKQARFLLDRLDEFIRDADDIASITCGWFGHVEPAIKRLEAALSQEHAPGRKESQ